ncbi:lipoprotein insertase outer membrane protein LolB [Reinekea thalattae]|uniref:Outer-membrane lipoprotein LolB n=1 Tax=Reinekea thalattae TaxID=2593301 RepID=A0A5C8Z9C4_9GAMM|nr:lipoprotein insertase outer membrane protein LolB [Reinekea thalattae]TXR53751.1 outer membrane lipoprotein LolB [Reinekea thalattae]
MNKPELDADWAFKGKMAVNSATESSSFNIQWLQQGDYYQIELSGPLRQGLITIQGQPDYVELNHSNGTLYAESLSQLVSDNTEFDLPLDYLQFWVRAVPAPFEKFQRTLDDNDQVATIRQAGWRVSISDYFTDDSDLPRKLAFAKADQQGKLIIREWSIQP